MQMFPDDLPLANIDADGYCCHFMRSSVRPTIHGLGFVYCIQSAWKKWPTIWHADVSRWLTLSIHGCLWILLLVCLSVHLSVCSFTAFSGGCAFADKSLGTNGIKFDMLMYPNAAHPSLPSMDQIIEEPTYFAGGTYTSLLDHIYIQNCTIFMSGVLDTYYSDHDAIFADIALHGYQQ